jgi:hypothetical protein
MTTVEVKIKGISPLLMHKYPLEPIEKPEKLSKEEQAEMAAYRDEETRLLYVPSEAIQRTLIGAATFSKGKGRASLQKEAAASLLVSPVRLSLGTEHYKIDARPVVIKATQGRIVRYRPRLDSWETTFFLEYDPMLMTEQQVRKIVDDAGSRVGLLDFRPERKGPYGRFMVTSWVMSKAK